MDNSINQNLLNRLWHGADYNYEQWLESPEILNEDFRLMKVANCTAMSVGIFSWSMLEPANEKYDFEWLDQLMDQLESNGAKAILATPSAAHPPWLSRLFPEVLRTNRDGSKVYHKVRQNFCRTSPVFREKTQRINTLLAERYKDHPALLLWHVSNEYGSTPCYCSNCLGDFRRWLEDRYGNLDSVNKAWWTTFWSHRYSEWEEIMPADPSNNGLMLDWQRYNSDQVLDLYLHEAAPLRQITPGIPVTTNFMKPDVGLNYWKIAGYVDLITWDSYPEWHLGDDISTAALTGFYHDLHRSYKQGQPFYLLESSPAQTNWQPVSRLKRPGLLKLASVQALAHGAMGVNYFQWRQSRGGEEKFHGAVISHREGETSRVFQDVRSIGNLLAGLPDLAGASTPAEIGLVYDYENEWALNLSFLPRKSFKEYQGVCVDFYTQFWQRAIPVDMINANQSFDKFKIVIAPMLYMLNEETAQRLADFVHAGGVLLTTYLTGWVDESDLCHLGGYPEPLGDVLGLKMVEYDTFGPGQSAKVSVLDGNSLGISGSADVKRYAELLEPETAEVLAIYKSEFYAGKAFLTSNNYGAGVSYHLGADPDQDFLTSLIEKLVQKHAIMPAVNGYLPKGVSVQVRISEKMQYLFVMNFNLHAVSIDQKRLVSQGWVNHEDDETDNPNQQAAYSVRIYSRKIL